MKARILSTFFLCLYFSGTIMAAGDVLPYKTGIVIDGTNNEWGTPLPKKDKTTGINYQIANDEKNLYFIISVADTANQRKIMRYGLEVWINNEGKKEKTTGVTFPVPATAKKGLVGGDNSNTSLTTSEFTLTGFLLENGKQPTKGCPVQVSISYDKSNCLIYELAVPFNTFYKEQIDASDVKTKFCFGFVVKNAFSTSGDITLPNGMVVNPGMMEAMARNMGGMDGGMHRMAEMGGFGGMNAAAMAEKMFWVKTGLAVK